MLYRIISSTNTVSNKYVINNLKQMTVNIELFLYKMHSFVIICLITFADDYRIYANK